MWKIHIMDRRRYWFKEQLVIMVFAGNDGIRWYMVISPKWTHHHHPPYLPPIRKSQRPYVFANVKNVPGYYLGYQYSVNFVITNKCKITCMKISHHTLVLGYPFQLNKLIIQHRPLFQSRAAPSSITPRLRYASRNRKESRWVRLFLGLLNVVQNVLFGRST